MGLFHLFQTTHGLTECRIVNPFKAQAQVKAHLVYPLPAGFVVSAIFENLPGVAHEAYFRVRNDDIAPSLGAQPGGVRDAGGVHHDRQSPALIATKSQFEPRRTLFDLRLAKVFSVGERTTLRANLDMRTAEQK